MTKKEKRMLLLSARTSPNLEVSDVQNPKTGKMQGLLLLGSKAPAQGKAPTCVAQALAKVSMLGRVAMVMEPQLSAKLANVASKTTKSTKQAL